MGRITRKKAAEVAEALHIDEDAVLELEDENEHLITAKETHLKDAERTPLGELEANSADGKSLSDDTSQDLKRSTRGKRGNKKSAKAKKEELAASTATQIYCPDDLVEQPHILPDENDAVPSPASEKAGEELLSDIPAGIPAHDDNKAVKSTRSQLSKLEAESKTSIDRVEQTSGENKAMKEEIVSSDTNQSPAVKTSSLAQDNITVSKPKMSFAIDAPVSPLPNAVPTILAHLRADTPAKRSMSNKENVEPPQDVATRLPMTTEVRETAATVTTPEATMHQSPTQPEDPITALDDLDEAVDNISKDLPQVVTSPEKPKVKRDTKKAAPVVRGTKASQARISLAQNADATGKAQPRPSTTFGRSQSVRQSGVLRPEVSTKRVPSGSQSQAAKAATNGEKKEVVIPHSKARPVSLSFPAPAPPAKSTKAPTQSTFQLPGEAVAAKLKAAREARMQKEAEEEQKPSFKARPVPSSSSKAPSVRQTATSKARESIMAGKDPKTSNVAANAAQKRMSSVTAKPPSAPKLATANREMSKSNTTASKPASSDLTVKKRPSTLANTSKPRSSPGSTIANANTSAQRISSNAGKGTVKGKEVFNRPAAAKAAAEKEKQEKEAAAKKARADAAERGRLASREWAEKQKKATAKKVEVGKEVKVGTGGVEELSSTNEQASMPLVESEHEVQIVEAVEAL